MSRDLVAEHARVVDDRPQFASELLDVECRAVEVLIEFGIVDQFARASRWDC